MVKTMSPRSPVDPAPSRGYAARLHGVHNPQPAAPAAGPTIGEELHVTNDEASSELRFDPPGPGFFELDPVHFPRPLTRYWTETHPAPFARGTSEFARFYGMLIDGLEMTYVNGFGYKSVAPAPDAEIPQRFQRADEVFAGKLWREQLREWDETCKPASIAKHRELQAVDPDGLSDDELVAYLERCRDHHAAMITQHMRFTASAVVPTGDFLAHVGDWTGLPPAELLGLMRGASPGLGRRVRPSSSG